VPSIGLKPRPECAEPLVGLMLAESLAYAVRCVGETNGDPTAY
jgi:hypothetical protein